MSKLVYQKIIEDLKEKIIKEEFKHLRLPDERTLALIYKVSRSSIKRALSKMENQGIIFKKRGSGTFINPLYLKNSSVFNYSRGKNLGVSDNFQLDGKDLKTKILKFDVIKPTTELRRDLFLKEDDFVYEIERLRLFNEEPFMIENGYIPIKTLPNLTSKVVEKSIFSYFEAKYNQAVTKSYLSIFAQPSNKNDKKLLKLAENEPVSIMEGIFFLDNGTPFEFSHMRMHYKYMKFNTFVEVER